MIASCIDNSRLPDTLHHLADVPFTWYCMNQLLWMYVFKSMDVPINTSIHIFRQIEVAVGTSTSTVQKLDLKG